MEKLKQIKTILNMMVNAYMSKNNYPFVVKQMIHNLINNCEFKKIKIYNYDYIRVDLIDSKKIIMIVLKNNSILMDYQNQPIYLIFNKNEIKIY